MCTVGGVRGCEEVKGGQKRVRDGWRECVRGGQSEEGGMEREWGGGGAGGGRKRRVRGG